ncbi:MAG: 16S rRNA (guanine(966)-N(2))-methyltransferase RsmD [Rhodobacteraceae bacterium]|nr:MAG: 16S rRNA (guanine(966)-N(2))-methyltransferase RsmD [Paracoccaceae bacterium]
MRIIGGKARGLRLAEVGTGDAQAHLRPTSDRVRESIFNLLINSQNLSLEGLRVLDLFAGTGALGLEALSRGAAHCTFVDDGATARALLRENIEKMRAMGVTRVLRRDATTLGDNRGPGFDLVFLDPPYGKSLGALALGTAQAGGWLAPQAYIVWEDASPQIPPAGFTLIDQRRYGETHVTFLRPEARHAP